MVQEITPVEARALIGKTPGAVFLDVRSQREFAQGFPEGALNVPILDADASGRMAPNPQFLQVVTALVPDRNTAIVCSCAVGGRSRRAAEILHQAGYTNAINMDGGFSGGNIPGWEAEGLPVSHALEAASYDAVLDRVGL